MIGTSATCPTDDNTTCPTCTDDCSNHGTCYLVNHRCRDIFDNTRAITARAILDTVVPLAMCQNVTYMETAMHALQMQAVDGVAIETNVFEETLKALPSVPVNMPIITAPVVTDVSTEFATVDNASVILVTDLQIAVSVSTVKVPFYTQVE